MSSTAFPSATYTERKQRGSDKERERDRKKDRARSANRCWKTCRGLPFHKLCVFCVCLCGCTQPCGFVWVEFVFFFYCKLKCTCLTESGFRLSSFVWTSEIVCFFLLKHAQNKWNCMCFAIWGVVLSWTN